MRDASQLALAHRLRLIVLIDPEHLRGDFDGVTQAIVASGAPALQLRAKNADTRTLFDLACRTRAAATAAGALFFVNDRFDVALASRADGVHVGPDDLPVADIRRAVGRRLLIGASTDQPDRAEELVRAGADYLGCGTVFPTTSKAGAGEVIGIEGLGRVVRAVDAPVVGIGGISLERAPGVLASGCAGVAVLGDVMTSDDPGERVRALLEAVA